MAETITAKFKNCYDDDSPEKEFIVKDPDGNELCRFAVRKLNTYQWQKLRPFITVIEAENQNVVITDLEAYYVQAIKLGVLWFKAPDGEWRRPLPDDLIARFPRGGLNGDGKPIKRLFDMMGEAVLTLNVVDEGELKNSARQSPGN